MTKKLKKIFAAVIAAALCLCTVFLAACSDGEDGKDGKDLDIYDVYAAVNEARAEEGLEELTFLEFVEEYFGYVSDQAVASADKTAVINHSLMCSVAIYTQFKMSSGYGIWSSSTYSTYTGSGVIIDVDKEAGDAYIVTNAHVVYDSEYTSNDGICQEIYVYLYGSDVLYTDLTTDSDDSIINYSGIDKSCVQVIGVSLSYDIAVLKVTGSDIIKKSSVEAAKFSSDTQVYVGEEVYAIGNPSFEGLSASEGIVSRDTEILYVDVDDDNTEESFRVFRITAAINAGNSGGAVFNSSGEIIGIANATALTDDNLVQGMCYALPANNVRRIAQSFIDNYEQNNTSYHYLKKALIGVTTGVEAESTYAEYNATTGRTDIYETVTVKSVSSGSLALGVLKEGDVLVSYAIGQMNGDTPSAAQSERYSGFYIPTNTNYLTDSRYCDTTAITRSYTLTEAMISVRQGDTVELVIDRDGTTYYMYFTYSSSDYFTQYA